MSANMEPVPGECEWTPSDQAQYDTYCVINEARQSASLPKSDLEILEQFGLSKKKLPKELKGQKAADAFQHAFELIGGIPRLALWADKNPTAFFSLYSKLIPATVKAQIDAKLEVNIKYSNPAFNQPIIDVGPSE